ncbi:YggT family protein [Anoxybacillus sp. LAT_35]|uniref:Integral membrane protein n=2 Tax=Anoxybacillus TaxID=150247 RepID=R4G189_9BACL|nr:MULTISPECIES: YggT family protein [Anoxybacillus]MCG5025843.1 YggT family protein [Anoxybacillus flavithermus]MCG6195836.1 YggT family protein [Anoxybacillus sp. LAT_38]MCG3085294.1 YggT family protein [Anoxybacillus sp. LAT27]MCG6172454.1 YggT family protein [Anoxybacillus sp. LAT_11]MCG6175190.1 YggT family protein [Anoxybacillus sp. LAT_31]
MYQIANFLATVIEVYSYAIIVYILMSWFPNARETKIGQFLANICEPYLEPFRRFIPPIGMIDISPIVALLVLRFATAGVYGLVDMVIRGL